MEKTKNKLIVTLPSDTEIHQTRVFEAPRDLVFKYMTDPKLIPQWWGPRGYTTVVEEMEMKPGGKWRFIQRNPRGDEFAFRGEYREVLAPERTVSTFEFEPMAGHISVEHTTYEDLGDGRTRVTTLSTFDSKEDRDGMLQSGMEQGAAETFDRFEEMLENLT